MKRLIGCAGAMILVAGCGGTATETPAVDNGVTANIANETDPAGASPAASAELRDANGQPMGMAMVTQVGSDLRVTIDGVNLPAGTRAAHVHSVGTCTAPTFDSAGPHWNPTDAQHGRDNPQGAHKGDMPNMDVGAEGRGSLDYVIQGATLTGSDGALLDADGAAVVIHANADDYRTDPTGNAGGRIACGVLSQ